MTPPGVGDLVRWDIVEQHLDEVAFLFEQREGALDDPRYTLGEVADRIDERLLANLDGLLIPGAPAAERLLIPALESGDATAAFAGALALLDGSLEKAAARVAVALGASPEVDAALLRALELTHRPKVADELLPLLLDAGPKTGVLLRVLAAKRAEIPHDVLRASLGAEDPAVVLAAIHAVALAADPRLIPEIEHHLQAADPAVRTAALEASASLGLRSAWEMAKLAADQKRPDLPAALRLLAQSNEETDLERVLRALEVPELQAPALRALGFSGRTRAAEVCLDWLDHGVLAPLAGDAFSTITGLAIENEYAVEPGEEAEEEEEDEEAQPGEAPPETLLPVPVSERVTDWWRATSKRFDPRRRYLLGQLMTPDVVVSALGGKCHRRAAIAAELAVRTAGQRALEVRYWAKEQLHAQAELRGTLRVDFEAPFGKVLRR